MRVHLFVPPMWARKPPDRAMVLDVQRNKCSNAIGLRLSTWLAYTSLPLPPPVDGSIGVSFSSRLSILCPHDVHPTERCHPSGEVL